MPLVRVDPRDAEHGETLRHRPADEALFRVEVEHVVLVDPRRHDQQRAFQHGLRRRRVLDELDQLVAEDHLAGRRRYVDADVEPARIGLADLERALAGFDILGEHRQAADQVGAVLLDRPADQLGIGDEEVGRRQGGGELPHVETRRLPGLMVEPLGLLHHFLGPARDDQIRLLEEIEDRVLGPFRVGEAGVLRRRRGHRLRGRAVNALQGRSPQLDELGAELGLRLDGLLRIDEPFLGDGPEGARHLGEFVAGRESRRLLFEGLEVGRRGLAGLLDEPSNVARKLFEIRHRRRLHINAQLIHGGVPPSPIPLPLRRISDIVAVKHRPWLDVASKPGSCG